jgi:hypothetical protein
MVRPVGSSPTGATAPTETKKEEIKSDPKKGSGETVAQETAAAKQGSVALGISTAGMSRSLGAVMAANLAQAAGIRTPSAAELKQIENCINNGDKQKAIELTVKYYNIDVSAVKGMPKYNKDLSGEGVTRRYTKEVEIGDEAFKFNGKTSPAWLASSILHETVHAKQLTDPQRLKNYDESEQTQHAVEVEAYDREIAEAKNTGVSPDMVKELERRRKSDYDDLSATNKKKVDRGDYAGVK